MRCLRQCGGHAENIFRDDCEVVDVLNLSIQPFEPEFWFASARRLRRLLLLFSRHFESRLQQPGAANLLKLLVTSSDGLHLGASCY